MEADDETRDAPGQGEAACPACGRPHVVTEGGEIPPHNVYGLASPCDGAKEC